MTLGSSKRRRSRTLSPSADSARSCSRVEPSRETSITNGASPPRSIGERKLLGSNSLDQSATAEDSEEIDTGKGSVKRIKNQKSLKNESESNRPKGFMQRLMEAAETAKEQSEQNRASGNGKKAGKKSGKRRKGK